ncbi:MAG: hypothetical protein RIS75_1067 [Actinomycetota bacterium]
MSRGRKLLRFGAVSIIILSLVSGVAYASLSNLVGNIQIIDIDDQLGDNRPTAKPGPDGGAPINIVVLGSDTRDGQGKNYGGSSYLGSNRSDTTILVHISGDREWASAVSIPRDTMVDMPDCKKSDGSISKGYHGLWNEAMQRGGPGCVIKTLEQITQIRIDHFIVVDFKGFKSVVNAVGGVEVCLTEAVNDKKSKLVLPKGLSTIDGETALAFVRARKTLGDGSDTSRIRRQQDFLASLTRKVTSAGVLLNPIKLTGVLSAVTESLATNKELGSLDGLKNLAFEMQNLRPSNIRFITAPSGPDPDNQYRVVFTSKAQELWTAIINDKQWPAPPDKGWDGKYLTGQPDDIDLELLNATDTAGLAKVKQELFEDLDYKVVNRDNATAAFGEKTSVWATKKFANKARTVAKALGLSEVKLLKKATTAEIVVVIGKDFKDPVEVRVKTKPKSSLYGPEGGRAADETDCSPA